MKIFTGEFIAAEMEKNISSPENRNLFKKAALKCCNDKCKCDSDYCPCKKKPGGCNPECVSCMTMEKTPDTKQVAEKLMSISETLESRGFIKAAAHVLHSVDCLYSEAISALDVLHQPEKTDFTDLSSKEIKPLEEELEELEHSPGYKELDELLSDPEMAKLFDKQRSEKALDEKLKHYEPELPSVKEKEVVDALADELSAYDGADEDSDDFDLVWDHTFLVMRKIFESKTSWTAKELAGETEYHLRDDIHKLPRAVILTMAEDIIEGRDKAAWEQSEDSDLDDELSAYDKSINKGHYTHRVMGTIFYSNPEMTVKDLVKATEDKLSGDPNCASHRSILDMAKFYVRERKSFKEEAEERRTALIPHEDLDDDDDSDLPDDYEACGTCGYDHYYDLAYSKKLQDEALKLHEKAGEFFAEPRHEDWDSVMDSMECPYCDSTKHPHYIKGNPRRRRCKDCGEEFDVTAATVESELDNKAKSESDHKFVFDDEDYNMAQDLSFKGNGLWDQITHTISEDDVLKTMFETLDKFPEQSAEELASSVSEHYRHWKKPSPQKMLELAKKVKADRGNDYTKDIWHNRKRVDVDPSEFGYDNADPEDLPSGMYESGYDPDEYHLNSNQKALEELGFFDGDSDLDPEEELDADDSDDLEKEIMKLVEESSGKKIKKAPEVLGHDLDLHFPGGMRDDDTFAKHEVTPFDETAISTRAPKLPVSERERETWRPKKHHHDLLEDDDAEYSIGELEGIKNKLLGSVKKYLMADKEPPAELEDKLEAVTTLIVKMKSAQKNFSTFED